MKEEPREESGENWLRRAQRAMGLVRNAWAQLIPFLLSLRRRPRVWNALRAVVALLGAALVVVPLGLSANWFAAVIGLVLFLVAALVPPTKPSGPVDDPAREIPVLK